MKTTYCSSTKYHWIFSSQKLWQTPFSSLSLDIFSQPGSGTHPLLHIYHWTFSNLVIFSGFFSFSCNSRNSSVSSPGSPPGNNYQLYVKVPRFFCSLYLLILYPWNYLNFWFTCAILAYLNDPFLVINCAESGKSHAMILNSSFGDFTDLPQILLLQWEYFLSHIWQQDWCTLHTTFLWTSMNVHWKWSHWVMDGYILKSWDEICNKLV